jgi:hypothetical protein
LLRNDTAEGNHWLGLKLVGASCNRDAIGARITWFAGGVQRSRLKRNGGSYLSSHDPREVLGLGVAKKLDWLEIRCPLQAVRRSDLLICPSTDIPHEMAENRTLW